MRDDLLITTSINAHSPRSNLHARLTSVRHTRRQHMMLFRVDEQPMILGSMTPCPVMIGSELATEISATQRITEDMQIATSSLNKLVSLTRTGQTTSVSHAAGFWALTAQLPSTYGWQERVLLLHELETCKQTSQVTGSNTRTTPSSRRHATSK
jgi:hypothetical protein